MSLRPDTDQDLRFKISISYLMKEVLYMGNFFNGFVISARLCPGNKSLNDLKFLLKS